MLSGFVLGLVLSQVAVPASGPDRPAAPAASASSSPAAASPAIVRRAGDLRLLPKEARPHASIVAIDRDALRAFAREGGGRLERFPLGAVRDATLDLRPIDPFAGDAEIEVVGAGGTSAAPSGDVGIHLAGTVAGVEGSLALLSVSEAGEFGYVEAGGHAYVVTSGPYGLGLPTTSYDLTTIPESFVRANPWECATEGPDGVPQVPGAGGDGDGGVAGATPCRQMRLAFDTDYEFLQLFGGNVNAAKGYVATLASALTTIYARDVSSRLHVGYLRLWQTSADPWTATTTSAQLEEFAGHWGANFASLSRDLAHFLSGRGLGGGVAYLPGLCAGSPYGLSANLAGSFPTPIVNNSGSNWDIIVVAHEIGHNFGAPHTHSYSPPIDGCGLSPQDCSAADTDTGTIMSYCHLCSGGTSNIRLEFHPQNVATILAHLDAVGCDFTGPATVPATVSDSALAIVGQPVAVDVLANEIEFNCEEIEIGSFLATSVQGASVSRSVGTGPGGRDVLVYLLPGGSFSGTDYFTYRARDASGQEMPATVSVSVLAPRVPENPIGDADQLSVSYYALNAPTALPNFATLGPYLVDLEPQIDYAPTNGAFASSTLQNNVGAVFKGWIDVPATGLWTFFANSNEGSRLWIGSTLVVDNDGIHAMLEKSGSLALAAGRHAFKVEFFERNGLAGLTASWEGPGVPKAPVPASAFSNGGADVPADLDNDGVVNAADLAIVLGAWGEAGVAADLNRDGTVSAADLAIVLANWS